MTAWDTGHSRSSFINSPNPRGHPYAVLAPVWVQEALLGTLIEGFWALLHFCEQLESSSYYKTLHEGACSLWLLGNMHPDKISFISTAHFKAIQGDFSEFKGTTKTSAVNRVNRSSFLLQEMEHTSPSLLLLPSINALVSNILPCPQEPLINSHPTVIVWRSIFLSAIKKLLC